MNTLYPGHTDLSRILYSPQPVRACHREYVVSLFGPFLPPPVHVVVTYALLRNSLKSDFPDTSSWVRQSFFWPPHRSSQTRKYTILSPSGLWLLVGMDDIFVSTSLIPEPSMGFCNIHRPDHSWLHNLYGLVQGENTEPPCSKVTKNFNMTTAEH